MAKNTPKMNTGKKANTLLLGQPLITEKAANASSGSVYVFDVALRATKPEIAKAFAALYKHMPVKVHTVVTKPKPRFRQTRRGSSLGFTAKTKKAYVYLAKGTTIDVV